MYWANATTEAATWLLGGGTPATTVTRNMTAAGASKFAVFTTYYSVNVNPNATGFATWIDGIGKAIGAQSNPAVVVLEPDAYPGAGSNQAKHDMLNAAIGTLKQDAPNAAVFLDIGNSGWLSAQTIATKVKTYSNYALIDGWASNTSNFHPTPNEVTYAQQLWALTCKPTIIDTSRNGLGKMPSTIINPPASEWAVGASFAWWPDNPAVFFNYHNKPWNESD
jgi:endoglucanase